MWVGVVGGGTMGAGVAQCAASAGHRVVVLEPDEQARESGPQRVRDGLRLAKMLGNESGGLPFTLVIAPGGRVLERKMGRLTPADLERIAASKTATA